MEFNRIREPLITIAMQINEEVLFVTSVYVNFAFPMIFNFNSELKKH